MSAPLNRPVRQSRPARCRSSSSYPGQRGLSLIELVMFIVIVGVGVAGILLVFNVTTKASADPLIQKQMLAIAEALIEEVQVKPFTFCDPDDPQAATAQSAGVGATGCSAAAAVENMGPEATVPYGPETRLGTATPFDNVNDYGPGPLPIPIVDITTGASIAALSAYSATIAVAGSALGGIAAAESLLITVTVAGPGNNSLVLQSYRTRYAPAAVP